MATFVYKALDARGTSTSGEIDGESKAVAAQVLRNKGLTVLDMNEAKKGLHMELNFMQRVKPKDLTVFSRQFATMVSSGLSMLRCLYVLEEQTPNKKLAGVIGQIKNDVEAGISLSDALEKHSRGLQQALREHGPGRRAGRHPGRGAEPPGDAAREGRPASGAPSSRRWSTRS